MKDVDHVVLAALLHDIGKFFERGELLAEYRKDEDMQQASCPPPTKSKPYRSHYHVLHTQRFCEELTKYVPMLQPQAYQRHKKADQHWVNLASRHHVATTPLETLVSHADHLASAEREEGNYYEKRIHQKTYLESMLERVTLDKEEKKTRHRLPLEESGIDAAQIFPQLMTDLQMVKNKKGVWLSQKVLTAEYAKLGNNFLSDMAKMPTANTASKASLDSCVTSLLAIMERYLCQVPAATNVHHPDISLFDHLRTTAAIAEGLYYHHEHAGNLDNSDAIKQEKTAKWRLVCGDFSGIQAFIYRLTSKGAAKALRGRSLYIQLLCDVVSNHLLETLNLYPTARLYASGGKFYLLIADCLEMKLRKEVDAVNTWLLEDFGGDVFLGLGVAQVCAKDFQAGNMSKKWKEANDDLMQNRSQRFAAQMKDDFFAPQTVLEKGAHCKVCGRDDCNIALNEDQQCEQCVKLKNLGQSLADASFFFWVQGDDRKKIGKLKYLSKTSFSKPLHIDLYVLKAAPKFSNGVNLHHSRLERLNQNDCMDANQHGYACSYRWLAKWDRDKASGQWEFDDFANHAKGIKRMGVLRMDVDNLGQLFIRGFQWAEDKHMGSLSRVITLSRQLNTFFSGYLMKLLKYEGQVQVIYAGGDDLFLIGSWDALPRVARNIEQDFKAFSAQNPNFTISGGMSMVHGKYPISRAAEMAGEAESTAKGLTRTVKGKNKEKSAFCMLETAIGWEDYQAVENLRDLLSKTSEKNHAIINRMRQVVQAQYQFKLLQTQKGMCQQEIKELVQWQKWRWQLVYNLQRLAKRDHSLADGIQAIQQAILSNDIEGRASNTAVLEWLELPTRWSEYLQRESK